MNNSSSRRIFHTLTFMAILALLVTSLVAARPVAAEPAGPALTCVKTASQSTLAQGETVVYTIRLDNTSAAEISAGVSDPVPPQLSYVADSASTNGVFHDQNKVVAWDGVKVPANGSVELSFSATAAAEVTVPLVVVNKAFLLSNQGSNMCGVSVLLVPPASTGSNLAAAFKTASRRSIAPGETLTYTIHMANVGMKEATATVKDPIPAELKYVADSASNGGVYDEATKTLTWTDVKVPYGEDLSLTFNVVQATTPNLPRPVLNVATIESDGKTLVASNRIATIPFRPDHTDVEPPVIKSVTIDDQDVLTDPQVTLHISATDNVAVSYMYVREWQLKTEPGPHWAVAKSSGWVPFQKDFPWTLGDSDGTHFVGVWVADSGMNFSMLSRPAMDFASLVRPGAKVGQRGMVPYMVYYDAGVDVKVTATPTTGDVDLYVWAPGNFGDPDHKSVTDGVGEEMVQFTTDKAGVYMILVYGDQASTYDLTITPAGGPGLGAPAAPKAPALPVVPGAPGANPVLTSEPVLSKSGTSPLAVETSAAPFGPKAFYLPVVRR